MGLYLPKEILPKVYDAAFTRHTAGFSKTVVLGFLAGAYIALGSLLAVSVGGGVPGIAASNPGIAKLLMGAVFPVGLMLCVIAGADLFTGNTAYFIPPVLSGKIPVGGLFRNWTIVWLANFAGALFVAYVLTYQAGIFENGPWKQTLHTIAAAKTDASFWKIFVKGIGANWLVALAVWLAFAAQDVSGKILAIWFPVMAFVAIGFEHSVANMYFLPAALFHGAPISWGDIFVSNLLPATLGNIVGGSLLTGGMYWFVYEKEPSR